jgi:hypothetical protein
MRAACIDNVNFSQGKQEIFSGVVFVFVSGSDASLGCRRVRPAPDRERLKRPPAGFFKSPREARGGAPEGGRAPRDECFFAKRNAARVADGVFFEWMAGYLPFLAGALPVGTVAIV